MKVGIVAGIVIAILALVVWLAPLKTVAYEVTVNYEDVETYYENEPYQVTENYTENVPLSFEANAYVDEDVIYEHHQIIIGGIVGEFVVSFSGFVPMFGSHSLVTTLSLNPGKQETAECPAESIDDWDYEVTPDTKEVEQERTVTKYLS